MFRHYAKRVWECFCIRYNLCGTVKDGYKNNPIPVWCMDNTAQSRQDESVISRRRRKTDYHCLGPWTAETSGKWPGGRKSPCQATAIKNTEEQQLVSEMASAKPLPILGGVAGSRCSAVGHRRDAVIRCQWLVHRHLTTAYRRQQ